MMWKILRAQIQVETYNSQVWRILFPKKQKGCHWGTRRMGDFLYIDQHIHKEKEIWWKNIIIPWIHEKKWNIVDP